MSSHAKIKPIFLTAIALKDSLTVSKLVVGIAILCLSGCGGWVSKDSSNNSVDKTTTKSIRINDLEGRISTGERILLDKNPNTQKQTAADRYAYGDYEQATSQWESSLKLQRNDPESLIYLNNARIGKNPHYTIAIPVPINAEINVAKEILRGAAQAQKKFNSNVGIDEKLIKLIIANDSNDPNIAQELANIFSQDSSILGVVGHFSSDVTLEAAQIYQEKGLVVISPTSSSTAMSNVGSYVFRTVSSDCFAGNALAEHLVEQTNMKNAAVVYNSASSYSTSMRDVFKSSLDKKGGAVVAEFNFNQPNFDIVNALAEIKAKNAEAIALFPNSSGMNVLETLDKTLLIASINKGELPLLGGDSLYKPRTLQLGQENVVDMVIAVPWHTDNSDSPFFKTAKELWGGEVNWRTVLTYDAVIALSEAIKINPTRSGVQQALLSPKFQAQGASNQIKFLPSGDRLADVELVKVVADNNSGFGYDFVPISSNSNSVSNVCN